MIPDFNPSSPTVIHIDINSCFATVEQQANPCLRGKPVAVAAYTSGNGCILTASYEAKQCGVKTGMRVRDGKTICPDIIVLPSDPDKYRDTNRKLLSLVSSYTPHYEVLSIDEIVMDMKNTPILRYFCQSLPHVDAMLAVVGRLKQDIKTQIGRWITVSAGIAPNRFLAKMASNLKKPDGLAVIHAGNVREVLSKLAATDLSGIKTGNGNRLRAYGITRAIDMYVSPQRLLQSAFRSVIGHYWWLWLHGYDLLPIGKKEKAQKGFSQSFALYKPFYPKDPSLLKIAYQLVSKMMYRVRKESFTAKEIHVGCQYTDWSFWHKGKRLDLPLFATNDAYGVVADILSHSLPKPVRNLSVSVGALTPGLYAQMTMDENEQKKINLTKAADEVLDKCGTHAVMSAFVLDAPQRVMDRVAFGQSSL